MESAKGSQPGDNFPKDYAPGIDKPILSDILSHVYRHPLLASVRGDREGKYLFAT